MISRTMRFDCRNFVPTANTVFVKIIIELDANRVVVDVFGTIKMENLIC